MIFRYFQIFAVLLLLSSCSSAFSRRAPIYQSERVYVYTLSGDEYPDDAEIRAITTPAKPLAENDIDGFINLLTYLKVEKRGLIGSSVYPVYYPAQMPELSLVLRDVLRSGQPNTRYVLVTRFDPFSTVLSKMRRNTLLFWNDGSQVHLVFGEIHTELLGDDFVNDDNWLDVRPVNLRRAPDNTRLIDSPLFSFAKIGDFTHLTHAVIETNELTSLRPDRSPAGQADTGNSTSAVNPQSESIEARLQRLEKLKSTGVIDQAEYSEQRRRILSEL